MVYVLIEQAELEVLQVQTYHSVAQANKAFESISRELSLVELSEKDLSREARTVIRFAGDEAASVTLHLCDES